MRINIGTNLSNSSDVVTSGAKFISRYNPAYKGEGLESIVSPIPTPTPKVDISFYQSYKQKFVLENGNMQPRVENQINAPTDTAIDSNFLDSCGTGDVCQYYDDILYNDSIDFGNNGFDDSILNNYDIEQMQEILRSSLANKEPVMDIVNSVGQTSSYSGFNGMIDFINTWRETGSFWVTMYGKTFTELMVDGIAGVFKAIGMFILNNGDLFFLLPMVAILFITFIVGTNKYSKFALPLGMAYFVSKILSIILG